MNDATVTLLQSASLGRQTLAAGVQVRVSTAQAQAWIDAGIAVQDGKTANVPDSEQNHPQARAEYAQAATEIVAKPPRSKRVKE